MPATFTRRLVFGSIGCLLVFSAGCEFENPVVPRVIPGPPVPSPVPLRAPYIWDTREELIVWTGNSVSRGSFSIDTEDSNGAIAVQVPSPSGMLLRGPDIDPPAQAIRTVRVRYRWFPERRQDSLSMWVAFEATNPPAVDQQPRAFATLTAVTGWQEVEFRHAPPLDVRYVYFGTYSIGPGVLKIDAITLAGG